MRDLSQKSWHCQLYRLIYGHELPTNLCPYFYKVMLAIILFLPLIMFTAVAALFAEVVNLFHAKEVRFHLYQDAKSESGLLSRDMLAAAFVVNWVCFYVFELIWFPFHYNEKGPLTTMGFGIYICTAAILLSIVNYFLFKGIDWLIDKMRTSKSAPKTESKESSLVLSYIKSKYQKHCPKINWK